MRRSAEVYADGYRVDQNARRAFDVDVDPDTVEEVQRDIDVVRPQVAQFFGIPLSGEEGPGFVRYEPAVSIAATGISLPGNDSFRGASPSSSFSRRQVRL